MSGLTRRGCPSDRSVDWNARLWKNTDIPHDKGEVTQPPPEARDRRVQRTSMSDLQLADLYVYPVKSLRGYAVDRVEISDGRIAGDRLWIVVDAGGAFMHQRDYPQMARVGTSL